MYLHTYQHVRISFAPLTRTTDFIFQICTHAVFSFKYTFASLLLFAALTTFAAAVNTIFGVMLVLYVLVCMHVHLTLFGSDHKARTVA